MNRAAQRLSAVREALAAAARAAGRAPESVHLIAVGKTFGAERLAELAEAGQRDFGENYVDELLEKSAALSGRDLCWHFIGPLQSNKTRAVAEHADWVHSVDRLKVARRLSAQRPAGRGPLPVCVQVNISGEASKSEALCEQLAELPMLRLKGLMSIPAPGRDAGEQYRALARLRDRLARAGHCMDVLSAGMSGDFAAAIAHGATHVRIGTALFGSRARRA